MPSIARDNKSEFEDEERRLWAYSIRTIVRAVVVVFIVLFSSIAACGITSDLTTTLDGERSKLISEGNAAVERAKVEVIKSQIELERARTQMISDLIDKGVNPLVARCAIVGCGNRITNKEYAKNSHHRRLTAQ